MVLATSPAVFQHRMESILREYLWKFVFVYIDDVIFFSRNIEDLLPPTSLGYQGKRPQHGHFCLKETSRRNTYLGSFDKSLQRGKNNRSSTPKKRYKFTRRTGVFCITGAVKDSTLTNCQRKRF